MKPLVASLFVFLVAITTVAAESPVKLETLTGTIHGTLLVPDAKTPVPVVLLIAGSGPTDRNGNTPALPGANNSLQMLAEGLATKGIASLRYDKRGIAASKSAMTSEADLRFETYIDDAAAWVKQLGKDERFSRVYVAGHSEGSLIGIVAAQKGGVAGVISIAGAGRSAAELIRAQVQSRLPAEMLEFTNKALDSLSAQKPVTDVPPMLNMLFRPSVQPYLMSWFRYDPAKEVAKLKVPVLVVQGTTDVQASIEDARLLGNPVLIEGMNHVLKAASGTIAEQMSSYSDPKLPVVPKLIDVIANFVGARRP